MKTKQITIGAVLIAVNIVLSYVAKLPTPTGFVSLVEAGIFIGGWHFGPKMGLAVGGLTGFLLDLFAGYPQWMFFSLIIHGLEGWIIGHFNVKKAVSVRIIGNLCGSFTMIFGYWLAGSFLLWITGGTKMSIQTAMLAGLTDVPANIMQVLVGFIVALLVSVPLRKWIR
ncbi:ECF transporter S component [Weissella sagaensis]|uniref:ECF transporter S component n=1 Tax=Weissella sagaensis TaxID=2559928 RepID=UPI00214C3555|nr:ECF transporter S component [Weissella sagaensis]